MTTREEAKARNTPEPRTHQINLRLSRAEYARLTKSAALSGLGRAAYLRMVLLEKWRAEERDAQCCSDKPSHGTPVHFEE